MHIATITRLKKKRKSNHKIKSVHRNQAKMYMHNTLVILYFKFSLKNLNVYNIIFDNHFYKLYRNQIILDEYQTIIDMQ